ncbi:MAG: hypothetical protein DI598_20505 [Pseudopedobacter saltans]|uniref:Uncharacterized protein n=1 Tax=Pseudopedobacter saltans TaxID=151895 RepID=A0A2W5E3B5_9SPHI|nr:MAG: hypothetical protein DI598_20505 [Pseudopedobacter saltans]
MSFPLAASLQTIVTSMNLRYFKKIWNESTGEELTDSWGRSIYYFETDENLNVIKQIQKFVNGKILNYDEQNLEDDFGFLTDQPLELDDFIDNEISKAEFYDVWNK